MGRIVHFELTVPDPAKTLAFYSQVFGWSSSAWDGPVEYHLVQTGPDTTVGINGGVSRGDDPRWAGRWTNVMDVESVDESAEKIVAAGGSIVVPKMPIPSVGWLAYAADVDGTVFGIMQEDPDAA